MAQNIFIYPWFSSTYQMIIYMIHEMFLETGLLKQKTLNVIGRKLDRLRRRYLPIAVWQSTSTASSLKQTLIISHVSPYYLRTRKAEVASVAGLGQGLRRLQWSRWPLWNTRPKDMLLSSSPSEPLSRAAGDRHGFPQSERSKGRGKWGDREEAGREGGEGIHLVHFKWIFTLCHQSQLKVNDACVK